MVIQCFASSAIAEDRTREIGVEAYIYAYPLVLMEITRRVSTNVEASKGIFAPMNQFAQLRAFPDHAFRKVVLSNTDTLHPGQKLRQFLFC